MSEPASISVLLAVWAGDRADWVRQALESLRTQTLPAAQVVIVQDGPVGADLADLLVDAAGWLPVTRLTLAENGGLAAALQAGLAMCSHELIARADADDICVPERFERQERVMSSQPDLSVLGGYVAEFETDPDAPYAVRDVPVGRTAVARHARWRSPINHPTVMMRRSHVLAVEGYSGFVGIEDYFLWGKLLHAGRSLDNLPEVLVKMRAGDALGRRRGGWGYARVEAALFRRFVEIGFLSRGQAVAGLAMRLPVRLLPGLLRSGVYRWVLRRRRALT